jgi:acetyl esterase
VEFRGVAAAGEASAFDGSALLDPLRDEGERYAEKLRQAGTEVLLQREADLVHGCLSFFALSTRLRTAALDAAEAIRSRLHTDSDPKK